MTKTPNTNAKSSKFLYGASMNFRYVEPCLWISVAMQWLPNYNTVKEKLFCSWWSSLVLESSEFSAIWKIFNETVDIMVTFLWFFSCRNHLLKKSEGIHELGAVQWPLIVCLAVSWFTCFMCLFKGIKSMGKVRSRSPDGVKVTKWKV